jgi:hypothetical protein
MVMLGLAAVKLASLLVLLKPLLYMQRMVIIYV